MDVLVDQHAQQKRTNKYLAKQITVLILYVALGVFTLFQTSKYIALAEQGTSKLTELLQFEQLPMIINIGLILFFLIVLAVGLRKARKHSWRKIIMNFILIAVLVVAIIAALNFLSVGVAEVSEIANEVAQ
jgi:cell division protein FtsW (lipid II flippase)